MDTPLPDNNLSAMGAVDIVENAVFPHRRVMNADRPPRIAAVLLEPMVREPIEFLTQGRNAPLRNGEVPFSGDYGLQQKAPFMTSQNPNNVQIDRVNSGAICTEIGERLRATLTGNPSQLPPYLVRLTERLDGVESGDVASTEVDLR